MNRTVRQQLLALALFAAAVPAVTITEPAAADVPQVFTSRASIGGYDLVERTVVAYCPSGKRVLGGGAAIRYDDDQVMLTQFQPVHSSDWDRFVVTGRVERGGAPQWWSMDAIAYCVDPLPGMSIETAVTRGSDPFQSAEARCPAGKVVVGAGGRISGGGDGVQLQTIAPDNPGEIPVNSGAAAHAVVTEGVESFPINGLWRVFSYAVCADASVGAVTVTARSGNDTVASKNFPVFCPDGTGALGSGAAGNGPDVRLDLVTAESMRQYVSVHADRVRNQQSRWALTGYAICAP